MSMEINGKYGQYPTDYARRLEEEREKVKETETSDKRFDLHDEYISSEKSGVKPSGLYRLGKDENGNLKVLCTTNTDQVDREIKKLKEQKQQLEQQIKAAAGDEEKVKELEKQLSRIEGELSQKDNDTYRRQNAYKSL